MKMDWGQILFLFLGNASLIAGNVGLIVWFRTESRNDWRHMDTRLNASIEAIKAETKDFHGRLCKIEARRRR